MGNKSSEIPRRQEQQGAAVSDDSHKRWDTEDTRLKQIWEHYDQSVAQKIVHHALQHKDITLMSLYHSLSVARSTCEREKKKRGEYLESPTRIERVIDAFAGYYSAFQQGGSLEPHVYYFGDAVKRLYDERTESSNVEVPFSAKRGLSTVSLTDELEHQLLHPKGPVFERLEPAFQKLISTDNFFEFLQLSARLMYDLSNYPPVSRGSAAVNTWIIDKIAREKFNVTGSLRPLLYDWTAFLETPDNYAGFYIISAAVKYLALLPDLYERDKAFYDSIPALMMEDPNKGGVLSRRESAWNKIQANVNAWLADQTHADALSEQQKTALIEIRDGAILFRTPSSEMVNFTDALASQNDPVTKDTLLLMLKQANLSEERLKELLQLNDNLSSQYLKCYGDEHQEAMLNEQWADLEILRRLSVSKIQDLRKTIDIKDIAVSRHSANENSYIKMSYINISSNPADLIADDLKKQLDTKPSIVAFDNKLYYVGNNTDWVPIEIFYLLAPSIYKCIEGPQSDPSDIFMLIEPVKFHDITRSIFNIDDFRYWLARVSFATVYDLLELPKDIFDLLKESNITPLAINLKEAICSGGVMIQDLPGLSIEQIKTISSPKAIASYRNNQFIRAADILNSPPKESSFEVVWNYIVGDYVLNSGGFSLLSGVLGSLFTRNAPPASMNMDRTIPHSNLSSPQDNQLAKVNRRDTPTIVTTNVAAEGVSLKTLNNVEKVDKYATQRDAKAAVASVRDDELRSSGSSNDNTKKTR